MDNAHRVTAVDGRLHLVPRRPRPVPALGDEPFCGSTAVAAGHVTHHELRGPHWRRVFPDVYVAASAPLTHRLRVRAACVLFPDAVVTGRSAAWLWGFDVAGPDGELRATDVQLTLPTTGGRRAGHQRVAGIRVRRAVLALHDTAPAPGLPGVRVTQPDRTALDLAAELPHDDAVVVVDQFCQPPRGASRRLTDLGTLRAMAAIRTGRGCQRVNDAVADADGKAGSPQETRVRLWLLRTALPRPEAQWRVRDVDGREMARVDFGWPDLRFAVEYDGEHHLRRLGPDRQRANRLHAVDWRVFYVTAADVHDPGALMRRIAAALDARRAQLAG